MTQAASESISPAVRRMGAYPFYGSQIVISEGSHTRTGGEMKRVDFSPFMRDDQIKTFREAARKRIDVWYTDPPSNASPERQAGMRAAAEDIRKRDGQIEDLLIAVAGVEDCNRWILSICRDGWAQWAQHIVDPEPAARVHGQLRRLRKNRDALETLAIELLEGLDPDTALRVRMSSN